jgi:hypothetical protein
MRLRVDIVEDSEVIEGVPHLASINLVLALFIITGKAGYHSPVALLISLIFCQVRSPQTWIPRGGLIVDSHLQMDYGSPFPSTFWYM